jgi:hypothetical protein
MYFAFRFQLLLTLKKRWQSWETHKASFLNVTSSPWWSPEYFLGTRLTILNKQVRPFLTGILQFLTTINQLLMCTRKRHFGAAVSSRFDALLPPSYLPTGRGLLLTKNKRVVIIG